MSAEDAGIGPATTGRFYCTIIEGFGPSGAGEQLPSDFGGVRVRVRASQEGSNCPPTRPLKLDPAAVK